MAVKARLAQKLERLALTIAPASGDAGGMRASGGTSDGVRLSEEQRLDWLRLIRSDNIGPRGIMATPRLPVSNSPSASRAA
jgi:DprA-like N-terminal HHH domain